MRTLLELLGEFPELGGLEALRYHNGYRTWSYSYADLYEQAASFAEFLREHGVGKAERVLLWGENRIEWAATFWGCIARGVQVVPLDFHSSPDFVRRVQSQVDARFVVIGTGPAKQLADRGIELPVSTIAFDQIGQLPPIGEISEADITEDDIVEIVYTSGTTGTPKGVVHRHRNICANLTPIGREARRYRRYARPFQPIRLMNMLPLSHMFGQAAGLFFPPLLGGAVVFSDDYSAGAIIETIRRERVSALITVPHLLENLRNHLQRIYGVDPQPPHFKKWLGAAETWWRYRSLHREFGLKFWCFVSGGARLDPQLESFWRRLGWVVVQGYGLTESSPVVAINHPFKVRAGSIGEPITGQDVKLAPDGEILVRGASVTSDYVGTDNATAARLKDGWLHTGDIGALDEEGHLYYRGRKKDVIVTSDGLNVFPDDIEEVLNAQPEVRDSAVVGVGPNAEERIHAVLIADPSSDLAAVVRKANKKLEPHQRIQGWSAWPEDDFPRTSSTQKVKRHEVANRLAGGAQNEPAAAPVGGITGWLANLTGRNASDIRPELSLEEDLGITSLQRMELLARLESELGVEFDENAFVALRAVSDLEAVVADVRGLPSPQTEDANQHTTATTDQRSDRRIASAAFTPRWSRTFPIRWGRRALVDGLFMPLMQQMIHLQADGFEHLDNAQPPLIFVSNHLSHWDTACIRTALPPRWKRLLAPAMSQDYFRPYLEPCGESWRKRWNLGAQLYLAVGLFNAYPLPQRMGGTRRALRYTGELIEHGYCPLVFPEGWRSPDGKTHPFKPGIGLMMQEMKVPVLPIWIEGTYEIQSVHDDRPQPGDVTVRFGPPVKHRQGESYEQVARRIEQAVLDLKDPS